MDGYKVDEIEGWGSVQCVRGLKDMAVSLLTLLVFIQNL